VRARHLQVRFDVEEGQAIDRHQPAHRVGGGVVQAAQAFDGGGEEGV
jgi:hypothetical protein